MSTGDITKVWFPLFYVCVFFFSSMITWVLIYFPQNLKSE